jgi:hypothetical protein
MYKADIKYIYPSLVKLIGKTIISVSVEPLEVEIETECGYILHLNAKETFGELSRFSPSTTIHLLLNKKINGVDLDDNCIDISFGDYSESEGIIIFGIKEIFDIEFNNEHDEFLLKYLNFNNFNKTIHFFKNKNTWKASTFYPENEFKILKIIEEDNLLEHPYMRLHLITN